MTDLLLTIDAGTSACKAIVFDLAGRMVARGSIPIDVDVPRPGWAELDAAKLLSSVAAAISAAVENVDAHAIRGIGVSGQLGLVPVDRQGNALRAILTWMDRRAHAEAEQIDEILPRERLYRTTGRRVDPEWAASKILWLQQHEAEVVRDTHKFLSLKDFVVHAMTGEFVADETHASYSLLFNVEQRTWEPEHFSLLGIDPATLPRVEPSTTVVGELTRQFAMTAGLPQKIPVIVGAPDGTAATLGAGLARETSAVNVVGTTDVVFACTDRPHFDDEHGTLVNCHAVPGKWIEGGPMSTTGGCLKWYCENIVCSDQTRSAPPGETVYEMFDQEAERLGPGCEKLLFIPSLIGERTPFWDPNARGVLIGLSLQHSRAHIYRAILEGSAFGVKHVVTKLEAQGITVEKIHLVGGGATSRLWVKIRADVLGKPVVIPNTKEATGLGTAILVGVALGLYESFDHAIAETVQITEEIEPNEQCHRKYNGLFPVFMKLRRNSKEIFSALAKLDFE